MDLLAVDAPNHSLLVDGSGGRGLSPERWVKPTTSKRVGFAGGLGPDNISAEYARIKEVAEGDFWIDMEGKLRDENDWFDTEKAYRMLRNLNELE
jgi:phosphoribosylanthranilate isomerase